MRIGIDISQCAFENTGVANYVKSLLFSMIECDTDTDFILFYSSLRQRVPSDIMKMVRKYHSRVTIKRYRFPPSFLSTLWNNLHSVPIETFVGDVDVFISSDWYQPPSKKAKMATIIYDMIVYKYPKETHAKTAFSLRQLRLKQNIVQVQKKRMKWVKKECDVIFCISESTKRDVEEILGINAEKLAVIYPGVSL